MVNAKGVAAITDSNIEAAARIDNLDVAACDLQSIAGITDGGVAAHCFSDIHEGDWEAMGVDERIRRIKAWLQVEQAFEQD